MRQYEKVSINPEATMTLTQMMKPTTTKQDTKPKLKSKTTKKDTLTKKQIEKMMDTVQTAPTSLPQNPKSSSKQNKLNIKEDKMMRVLNYQNSARFGNGIRKDLKFSYTRDQLSKKTIEQIDNILYRIRNYLNNRGMDGIYEQMVRTTATGYENIVSEFYDIEGFSEMLTQNPAFWDAFERWKIERTLPDIPPSFQLCYIIASTTLMAHMRKTSIQTDIRLKQQSKNIEKDDKNDDKNKKDKTILSFGTKLS